MTLNVESDVFTKFNLHGINNMDMKKHNIILMLWGDIKANCFILNEICHL